MIERLDLALKLLEGDQDLLDKLLVGIDREDLIDHFRTLGLTPVEADVRRMNVIGGLRSIGFVVLGGRQGRHLPYRIIGYEKKVSTPREVIWSSDEQELLEWIDNLKKVDGSDYKGISEMLSRRDPDEDCHENDWLFLWSYELIGNSSTRVIGYLYREGNSGCVIRRASSKFSIIDLNMTVESLDRLIRQLSRISLGPVTVRNLQWKSLPNLIARHKGSTTRGHQTIYNLQEIVDNPREFLGKQSWKQVRRNLREIDFSPVRWDLPDVHDQTQIIDQWRDLREASQRQLAVGRDYVCSSTTTYPGKISLIGYREAIPCSYRVLDRLANNPEIAADLVEKSLNYSTVPGGKSGTSDASLYWTSEHLLSFGVKWINGGESIQVSQQLLSYKSKYGVKSTSSILFTSSTPFKQTRSAL